MFSRRSLLATVLFSVPGILPASPARLRGLHAVLRRVHGDQETLARAIAIPSPPPIIVAAYITQCRGPESKRAALLAKIGQLALRGRE